MQSSFSIEKLFLRITVLEDWWQVVFSTDSGLSYVCLQYKSEKVHGLFCLGWKNQEHTVIYQMKIDENWKRQYV